VFGHLGVFEPTAEATLGGVRGKHRVGVDPPFLSQQVRREGPAYVVELSPGRGERPVQSRGVFGALASLAAENFLRPVSIFIREASLCNSFPSFEFQRLRQ
jgi:hypothetical protein